MTTAVTLKIDGSFDARVVGGIAETVKALPTEDDWDRVVEIFKAPSLKFVSFTITEKGYSIRDTDGEFTDRVKKEMADPKRVSSNAMGIVAALLYERYKAGKLPITLLSMDNVSHNGSILKEAIFDYAKAWVEAGLMEAGFIEYLEDENLVSFPWSMIDKITPAADESIAELLKNKGYMDVDFPVMNGRKLAPSFANAEETEYLVVEDAFPNGKPNWDKKGVIFTDRETVDKAETMKVATCLNPLHTALAVYGCLLDYNLINEEMKDEDLVNLINGVGYKEGMPVVIDPEILDPKEFLDTVVNVRLPNPFLPDMPQRIATDTSQKLSVRFGKTISEYMDKSPEKLKELEFIPAVLAGWIRYLMGVDDQGREMKISPDPLLEEMQGHLKDLEFGDTENLEDILEPILKQETVFGVDLYKAGLTDKIIENFAKLNEGPGAVRKFLQTLPKVEIEE